MAQVAVYVFKLHYYLQKHGIDVIPVASWLDRSSFDWCLDGLPKNSSIAVSTNGCLSDKRALTIFFEGVDILQSILEPSTLIVCGRPLVELSHYKNIFYYPSFSERKQRRQRNGK